MKAFLPAVSIAAAALFLGSRPAQAQKTDVVVLQNGDRVTGEIKYYDEGRLALDTSHSGWIKVKWSLIVSITSDKLFDVETTDGVHHYGALSPTEPAGGLTIGSGDDALTVSFFDVFDLAPVYRTFWRRWEGSLDLGFNYTQSSDLTQFNLNFQSTYRMRDWQLSASLTSFFSRQNDVTGAERGSLGLRYDRYLPRRWLVDGGVALERNIQLGLKLRALAGVGVGRNVIQTNQTQLTPYVGVVGNREQPVEGEATYNVEGLVGCRYSYFMYDFPKVTIGAQADLYPSFTVGGRIRLEASASAKREIISDFYLSISLFDSFDSRDPTSGQSRNDWGPTVSLGWQF